MRWIRAGFLALAVATCLLATTPNACPVACAAQPARWVLQVAPTVLPSSDALPLCAGELHGALVTPWPTKTCTPTPTPTCTETPLPQHSAHMTLDATSSVLRVGDVLTVTARLYNDGPLNLGEPLYWLGWDPFDSEPLFEATTPSNVVHYLAVVPGAMDEVQFGLRAIRAGEVSVCARTSFEVHIGYPGPAYWGGSASLWLLVTVEEPPTPTSTPTATCSVTPSPTGTDTPTATAEPPRLYLPIMARGRGGL